LLSRTTERVYEYGNWQLFQQFIQKNMVFLPKRRKYHKELREILAMIENPKEEK
jgi:hypothetical protein